MSSWKHSYNIEFSFVVFPLYCLIDLFSNAAYYRLDLDMISFSCFVTFLAFMLRCLIWYIL